MLPDRTVQMIRDGVTAALSGAPVIHQRAEAETRLRAALRRRGLMPRGVGNGAHEARRWAADTADKLFPRDRHVATEETQ